MRHLNFLTARARIWAVANFCAVALYLHISSTLWPLPGDEGNPGGPGDALYFMLTVAPILLAFMATNLAALVHVARTRTRTFAPRVAVWALIAGVWLAAYAYDIHRSRSVLF